MKRRFVIYAAIGALATAVHFAVLAICVESLRWPAAVGSGLGALVGAQVAYAGNRHFTFAHRGPMAASWPRFMATAAAGGLVGMAMVAFGVHLGLHYLVAQAVATLSTLALTFTLNRIWTFR